ncbi:MAG: hypothetical protein AAF367_17725 [Pseudomonadota bacterium]
MPAPIALTPLAWKAAQIGAVAAVTWYATRHRRADGPREVWRERVLDEVAEGVETDFERSTDAARAGGAARLKRTVRLGSNGPGVELDATFLTRLRLRRV